MRTLTLLLFATFSAVAQMAISNKIPEGASYVEPSTPPTGERYCWKDAVTHLDTCKDSNGTTFVHTWIEVGDISAKLDLIIALLIEKAKENQPSAAEVLVKSSEPVKAGTMAVYDGTKWVVIR